MSVGPTVWLNIWTGTTAGESEKKKGQATVFIMHNPFASDSPDARRVQWAVALLGVACCVPHVYTHDHTGPWVRMKCALTVHRFFFATQAFRD